VRVQLGVGFAQRRRVVIRVGVYRRQLDRLILGQQFCRRVFIRDGVGSRQLDRVALG
jgi:hypothetical protein